MADLVGILRFVFATYLQPFFSVYVIPYLPTLILVLAAVGLASWLDTRKRRNGQIRALRMELAENLEQAKAVLQFVSSQKEGAAYVVPVPRFHTDAFEQLRNSGYLQSLKRGVREQLVTVYSAIERVDDASNRQEELLWGAASTSPVAPELRAQTLAFIRDTVSNMILTRLEQFATFSEF
jgi:hypothetical protein